LSARTSSRTQLHWGRGTSSPRCGSPRPIPLGKPLAASSDTGSPSHRFLAARRVAVGTILLGNQTARYDPAPTQCGVVGEQHDSLWWFLHAPALPLKRAAAAIVELHVNMQNPICSQTPVPLCPICSSPDLRKYGGVVYVFSGLRGLPCPSQRPSYRSRREAGA
jgi:hypothetical protein